MGTSSPEQPLDGTSDHENNASNVLSFTLAAVIPSCAVLTVVLIFLVWFMSDRLQSTRRPGEGDDDEPPPECPKYSGLPGRTQDQAPPPYEVARSQSGSGTDSDRRRDDRATSDENVDSTCQHRGESRQPTASDLSHVLPTTCLNPKPSSIREASAA